MSRFTAHHHDRGGDSLRHPARRTARARTPVGARNRQIVVGALVAALSAGTVIAAVASSPAAAAQPQKVIVQDAFNRVTARGLGSATVGGAYTSGYRPAAVKVSGGGAHIARMAPGKGYRAMLPHAVATNEHFTLTFTLPALPVHGRGITFTQVLRHGASGTEYDAKLRVSPAGAMLLSFSQRVGTAAERFIGGEVVVAGKIKKNQRVDFEASVTGTTKVHLSSRAWVVGKAVPAFQAAKTDSSAKRVTKPGSYGFSIYVSGSTSAMTAGVTNITGQNATPSAPPVTKAAAVGNLHSILAAAPAASTVLLGAGKYSFKNFSDSNTMGIDLKRHSLHGAGSAKTTLEMTTDSSTKAGMVPTALWSTNPLYLISTNSGSPTLGGFTLLGTGQGHLYNGFRVGHTANARISDVKVSSVPGNNSSPPGETFGINDWRTRDSVYRDIQIDGRNNAAAGFGVNSSSNITIDGLYSHDNKFSAGITYWQTASGTLTDYVSANNKKGINFEQDSGTFNIVRPKITGSLAGADITVFSNIASNKITITDPILAAGHKLRIKAYIGAVAYGAVNKQRKSDIKVMVNGVNKTAQLVQWI